MNAIPILIIGAPAVLAVIAFKKAERDQRKSASLMPKQGRTKDWDWPKRWRPVAKTGDR